MAARVLALVLLLVACRPILPTPAPSATPPRPRHNPTDTIVVGLPTEPTTLAAPPADGESARLVGQLLFAQLVGLDAQLAPRADLAEAVPTLENGGATWIGDGDARQLQVTFKLRPGARWSDGQPVTARDVVFTWQLALNPTLGGAIDTERRLEKVEAPDDATAVFTFFSERSARAAAARQPNRYGFLRDQQGPVVDPLYAFGLPDWWVYPAHALGPLVDDAPATSPKAADALAKGQFARQPVGAGPFRLASWAAGDRLTLAARSDYHGGAPRAKTLVLKLGTTDALRAGLRDGDVDLLVGDAAANAEPSSGVRIESAPDTAWEHLDLNLDDQALRDPAVRSALMAAIDREALARAAGGTALDGVPGGRPPVAPARAAPTGTPAGVPSPCSSRGARGGDCGPDPAAAGRALDAAGWAIGADGVRTKSGHRLQLRLLTTDSPLRARLAGAIAQQLAQVGVEVRVEARPAAELFDRPAGRLAQRDFDLALFASVGGPDPLSDLADLYGSAAIPGRGNAFTGENVAGLRSAELDRAVGEAAGTLDANRRLELLRTIQEVVARELPTIPLFVYPRAIAVEERLLGARPAPRVVGETWNAASWSIAP